MPILIWQLVRHMASLFLLACTAKAAVLTDPMTSQSCDSVAGTRCTPHVRRVGAHVLGRWRSSVDPGISLGKLRGLGCNMDA